MSDMYAMWQGRKVLVRFDIPVMDFNPPLYTIEYTDDDGQQKLESVFWEDLEDLTETGDSE